MEFEETSEQLEENISPDELLADDSGFTGVDELDDDIASAIIDDEEAVEEALEEASKKEDQRVRQAAKHSLRVRRAIEDFFEERRTKEELDYLFDDEDISSSKKRKK